MDLKPRCGERIAELIEKGSTSPTPQPGCRGRSRPRPDFGLQGQDIPRVQDIRQGHRHIVRVTDRPRRSCHHRRLPAGPRRRAQRRLFQQVRVPGQVEHGARCPRPRGMHPRGGGGWSPLRGPQADHTLPIRDAGQPHQFLRLPHGRGHEPEGSQRGGELLHPLQFHP